MPSWCRNTMHCGACLHGTCSRFTLSDVLKQCPFAMPHMSRWFVAWCTCAAHDANTCNPHLYLQAHVSIHVCQPKPSFCQHAPVCTINFNFQTQQQEVRLFPAMDNHVLRQIYIHSFIPGEATDRHTNKGSLGCGQAPVCAPGMHVGAGVGARDGAAVGAFDQGSHHVCHQCENQIMSPL